MPRILFVEDDPVTIEMLECISRQYLPCNAKKIKIVTDSSQAIELLRQRPFDFVVLDYQLADGKTAFDVISFINQQPQHRPEIVMLTTNQEKQTLMEAFRMGVTHYILKPIHFDVVGRVIQEISNFHHRNSGMRVMLDQRIPVFRDFKSDVLHRLS
jgi:CheY-like chemotaxis protein